MHVRFRKELPPINTGALLLFIALYSPASTPALKAQSGLISTKPPVYPLAAKAAGIDGTVILKGTISTEGKMENIHVLSGPPELRQAAVDAVSAWRYKPYKNFGRVVTVDTTVTVNFTMGKGKEKSEAQAKAQAEMARAAEQAPTQDLPPAQ